FKRAAWSPLAVRRSPFAARDACRPSAPLTSPPELLFFAHDAKFSACPRRRDRSMSDRESLTRRESQVMDVIYELGEATAREVQERLPKPPSYSAVRAGLSRLVEQGHLKYRESGPRYVYVLASGRKKERQAALRKLRSEERRAGDEC